MILKTGFGYYVSADGRKLHKFDLSVGEHPDPVGFSVVEVNSKEELDKIILDKSDKQIVHEEKHVKMKVLRKSGIDKLKNVAGLSDDEVSALIGE